MAFIVGRIPSSLNILLNFSICRNKFLITRYLFSKDCQTLFNVSVMDWQDLQLSILKTVMQTTNANLQTCIMGITNQSYTSQRNQDIHLKIILQKWSLWLNISTNKIRNRGFWKNDKKRTELFQSKNVYMTMWKYLSRTFFRFMFLVWYP